MKTLLSYLIVVLGLASWSAGSFAEQSLEQTITARACCGCIAQRQACLGSQLAKVGQCSDLEPGAAKDNCMALLLQVCSVQLEQCSQLNKCPDSPCYRGCANTGGSLKFIATPFSIENSAIAEATCLIP